MIKVKTGRAYGPYSHARRWRVIFREPGGAKTTRSYATKDKAQRVADKFNAAAERKKQGFWVYFIQAGDDGPIKIGKAKDVAVRLRALQTGSVVSLSLLHAIPPGGPTERAMHRRFERHRGRGEWFDPAPELLEFIAGLSTK